MLLASRGIVVRAEKKNESIDFKRFKNYRAKFGIEGESVGRN